MNPSRPESKGSTSPAGSFQPLKAPELSLSKGGGSLKGAEEKFQANPVTGSAGVSIGLPISPGREGATPSLSLGYDSGSGTGPFGLGWSLSLPSISRQTTKRLPLYDDTTESDVFVMAGAEDLVPVEDLGTIDGFRVRRYQPRIEGGFARIERWTDTQAVSHWRVYGSDATATWYGDIAECRVAHPGFPERVFRWLPSQTIDSRGNVTVYRYIADGAQRILDSLLYGNAIPSTASRNWADFHFRLSFAYEDRPDPHVDRKPGFEVATSKRCAQVAMEHRFPELGPKPLVVKSLDLSYVQGESGISLLATATHSGHKPLEDGTTQTLSMPPLAFDYSTHAWNDAWQDLPQESIADVAGSMSNSQWIDLWGEGIPGLLVERGDQWWYKRNLGEGRLAPAKAVSPRPRPGKASGLLDLEGQGRMWLVQTSGSAGSVRLSDEGEWSAKKPFRSVPKIDFANPRLRMLDLDGDGRADAILDEGDHLTWYPSEGEDGYGVGREIDKDMEGEPVRLLACGKHEAIFLADMSGDGLPDVARVGNSEVCYWPNLGHGRFGEKIVMAQSPWITEAENFDPSLVRLADLDGTGPADLVYMDSNRFRIWLNHSGASYGAQRELPLPGNVKARFEAADVLGTGTACLFWTSSLAEDEGRPARYLDLMRGKKPHLMTGYRNNMGKQIGFEYTPSTTYYRSDRAAGTPWATRLPYVVQCLSRATTTDLVTGWTHSSLWTYHHGCHDGHEREFRGFGRVEHTDTEVGPDSATDQDPVLTKTWFHLGVAPDRKWLPGIFALEYWNHSVRDLPLGSTEPMLPSGMSPQEWLEAHRAFKGRALREEVYGLDGTPQAGTPYATTDRSYEIERIAPSLVPGDRHRPACVWMAIESETIARHLERDDSDPRISHRLTLSRDTYGRAKVAVAVAYPRKSKPAGVPSDALTEQGKMHVIATEVSYSDDFRHPAGSADRRWRMGPARTTTTSEITGIEAPSSRFSLGELSRSIASAVELAYEGTPDTEIVPRPSVVRIQKRAFEKTDLEFWNDPLSGPRPATDATPGLRGMVRRNFALAFTPELLTGFYGLSRLTDADLSAAGYEKRIDGNWWATGGYHAYASDAADHFCLPIGLIDPFGTRTTLSHDPHDLLPTKVVDALGNTHLATNDYRILAPVLLTDPNDNRTAIDTDALGIVVRSAVMGKEGANEGDTLADPTVRIEYSYGEFAARAKPNWIRTFAREKHGAGNPRWQESVEYSDGLGHVVMTKVQAEPGLARKWDPVQKKVVEIDTGTALRWVGTGRTILNNKGKPVKQYEPYFGVDDSYESHEELVETGVTPVLHYDPMGRLIRTDLPDGTFTKVEFTPWIQSTHDANDTVLQSDWYTRSIASADPAVRRAAQLAATHANTPTTAYLDSLGRSVVAVAQIDATTFQTTISTLDLEGNLLRQDVSRDASTTLTVLTQGFDILGRVCMARNPDSGAKLNWQDVAGATLRSWEQPGTAHERSQTFTYDALRRPLSRSITASGTTYLAGVTTYGESLPDAKNRNARGLTYSHKDGAGIATDEQRDFHGMVTRSVRQLTTDTQNLPDWSKTVDLGESFTTLTAYDALGRVTRIATPHNGSVPASLVFPVYNEANLLDKVQLRLRGATASTDIVSNIDYDAKGQRQRITYGNGATTRYDHDPLTWRLTNLLTTRSGGSDTLQNLSYTYDAVGNVVQITDAAQQTVFFDNQVVRPAALYEYDSLYRLVKSTGREHSANDAATEPEAEGFNTPQNLPSDGQSLRNYTRSWTYDSIGNILSLVHQAAGGNWTRTYAYESDSNRLASTTVGAATRTYSHNAHGSLENLPHLSGMSWTPDEHLHTVARGTSKTWYSYDSTGQRVRKYTEKGGFTEERLYLGGWEIYRKRQGSTVVLERESLHILDGNRRVALIETKTIDTATTSPLPRTVTRYQLDNHLQSASLELDEIAQVISYEEYYPYGDTSYRSARSGVEVSDKRYRYTGKEKDEESGLYYHGARYYAPWLGRWTAADPAGMVDGPNLYAYVRGNPLGGIDPTGTQTFFTAGLHGAAELDNGKAPKSPSLEEVAKLHGKTQGRLQTLGLEISELGESFKTRSPYRIVSLEHFEAASGITSPIQRRASEVETMIQAGLAEEAGDNWTSTVFQQAIEGGLVTNQAEQDRFLAIAESEQKSTIYKWAAWRFVERALAVLSLGSGSPTAIFARAPQSAPATLNALDAAAQATGVSGKYVNVIESMSSRAIKFQELVSGIKAGTSFLRGGVKFDFLDTARRVLVDAKGPGYASFVDKTGEFYSWFKGAEGLVDQARRQIKAANEIPVEWVFAESKALQATQKALAKANVTGITLRLQP